MFECRHATFIYPSVQSNSALLFINNQSSTLQCLVPFTYVSSVHNGFTHSMQVVHSCLCIILRAPLEEGWQLSLPTSDNSTLTTPFPLCHTMIPSPCSPPPPPPPPPPSPPPPPPKSFQLIPHFAYTVVRANFSSPLSPTQIRRNPESHSRPTFEILTRELARDPETLLSWSEQDKAASSKAVDLGAALEEGKPLYQELQQKYK